MPKSDRRECQEIHVLCVQGMLCYAECTATAMRTHAHVTDDGASPRNAPVGILCTQDQREIPCPFLPQPVVFLCHWCYKKKVRYFP